MLSSGEILRGFFTCGSLVLSPFMYFKEIGSVKEILLYDSFRHWQLLHLVINKWRRELTTLRVLMNTRGSIFRSLQYLFFFPLCYYYLQLTFY